MPHPVRASVLVLSLSLVLASCEAETEPATNVLDTAADLRAKVSWAQGEGGSFWFEYRPTPGRPDGADFRETVHRSFGPMTGSGGPITITEKLRLSCGAGDGSCTQATLVPNQRYEYKFCGILTASPTPGTTGIKRCFFSAPDPPPSDPPPEQPPLDAFETLPRRDVTPPDMEVGGDLRASAHAPLTGDTYDLWADAEDGSATDRQSGIRNLEILADGSRVAFVEKDCQGASCNLDLDWDFLRENFAIGRHVIEAVARDWAGNVSRQTLNVDLSADRTPDPPDTESPGQLAAAAPFAGRPASGVGPACSSLAKTFVQGPVLNLTHRSAALGGGETTVRYTNGEYLVVRCTAGGDLSEAEHVGPIPTPEGMRMLILSRTVPTGRVRGEYLTHYPLYGAPNDPRVVSAWHRWRDEVLESVPPPTRPNLLTP